MKYAFIVLIALYLIIYGCSPDTTEKAKESHEQKVQTTVKDTPKDDKAAGAIAKVHQTPAAVVPQESPQSEAANIEAPAVILQQPVVIEQKPAPVAEPDQVVMPCGRTMTQDELAANAPPCMQMQAPESTEAVAAAGTQQELEAALEKVVQTTNDMVLATRELVIATQAILDANKQTEETQPVAPSTEAHGTAAPQQ